MARTIQSPGVEIREQDFTLRAAGVQGTSVFLAGFSDQGPIDEVLQPGSISEFELIYGSPTNSAEQYFYQTAKAILGSSPARLVTTRLPYGVDKGDGFSSWKYSALVYPARPVVTTNAFYSLTGVTIVNQGSGYSPNTKASVVGNIATTGTPASASVGLTNTGSISSITIIKVGYKYTEPPTIILTSTGTPVTIAAFTTSVSSTSCYNTEDVSSLSQGFSGATTYLFGRPTHIELSAEQYQSIIQNNIDWTNTPSTTSKNTPIDYNMLGGAGMIVLNRAQTSVNNSYEGYYVGIIDNNNANPATPFNGVLSVDGVQASLPTINNYINIPKDRLNFALSATKFGDGTSVSEIMENLSENDLGSKSFDDTVSFGLFKLRKSVFAPDTISLDFGLAESAVGSLDWHRKQGDQNAGPDKTFFIGNLTDSSSNVRIAINPYISNQFSNKWTENSGLPGKKVRFISNQLKTPFNAAGFKDTFDSYTDRVGAVSSVVETAFNDLGSTDSIFTIGVYSNTVTTDKSIGGLVGKLERAFELIENPDIFQINLAVEAGLGTIFVNSIYQSNSSTRTDDYILSAGPYVDSKPLNQLSAFYTTNFELGENGTELRGYYTSVSNVFVNAAEKQRKDFMVILDPLRNIFVQGANAKIVNSKKIYSPQSDDGQDGFVTTNFSQHIYWPLRHQFGTTNSSYAATYGSWAQVIDATSNRQIWAPFSGFAAAIMANTDSNFQPWAAPAGFTRGVVLGVNDIGVYPKQKQRDQLYKISVNPVVFFPAEGFVVFGQKTLLKKPSAFDRINVRRLFLNLETATRDTAKFFVFEPNTYFTRTQVINTLSPIFDAAKNTEGVYDYLIVCDERNNTPDIIDNNELKVDIYIKPVRTAEFILVTFYATKTSQSFEELLGA